MVHQSTGTAAGAEWPCWPQLRLLLCGQGSAGCWLISVRGSQVSQMSATPSSSVWDQRPAWARPAHGNGRDTRLSRCREPDALRCCITSAGVLLAKASHVAELSIKLPGRWPTNKSRARQSPWGRRGDAELGKRQGQGPSVKESLTSQHLDSGAWTFALILFFSPWSCIVCFSSWLCGQQSEPSRKAQGFSHSHRLS